MIIETDIPIWPETLIWSSKAGHIYAIKTDDSLFGFDDIAILYCNREGAVKDADLRNEVLAVIGDDLDELSEIGNDLHRSSVKEIKCLYLVREDLLPGMLLHRDFSFNR